MTEPLKSTPVIFVVDDEAILLDAVRASLETIPVRVECFFERNS